MPFRMPRPRPPFVLIAGLLALVGSVSIPGQPAHAAADRLRLGSADDVSRPNWSGPAFTMNGAGGVVPASMTRAVDTIRAGTGKLDVVVLAGSSPSAGSKAPECDAIMRLDGVNSCTSWALTAASDGDNPQVNADVRNAEFVYFAGGDQCRYTAWRTTALRESVRSVVAKGGGSGGGSAGHHINSSIVYDACEGSATSDTALDDPYDSSVSFTKGMFAWPNYADTINDSHFVTRDRMGRTMAFVARTIKDGLTSDGKAWGVGVEEGGGSLYLDKNGLATAYGKDTYVVLGDHTPEQAAEGKPLTFKDYKIWHLTPGDTFDFRNRPTCGYYRRSVTAGVPDSGLYDGTPERQCGTPGGGTTPGGGSSDGDPEPGTLTESEPNDSRSTADDASALRSPASVTGSLPGTTDRDYFRLTLAGGRTTSVNCAVPPAYDADIYLADSSGRTVERSVNDGAGTDESLAHTRTGSGSGTYYLEVDAHGGSGTAPYTCTVTERQG